MENRASFTMAGVKLLINEKTPESAQLNVLTQADGN